MKWLRKCSLVLVLLSSSLAMAQESVEEVMDGLITRLYDTSSLEELRTLTHEQVLEMLSPQEREVLATRHWMFDANVPVVVSVLRNIEQETVPYWLEASGFKKSDLRVENMEGWVYEVWQKEFPAGRVGLGVGGLDNFRPHYLVAVRPQQPGDALELSNFHPANQQVVELKEGAMTYHDWTELVLTKVPEELKGQKLLTTIRGRGKEAAVVGAFRETPFPSTEQPAPIFLTWSDDPETTQNLQWRTSTKVNEGAARIRKQGEEEFQEIPAELLKMEDRMLANDRYCHWFTAVARELAPGTVYEYQVGSPSREIWSEVKSFKTAPDSPERFTFFHFSDTHSNEQWGKLAETSFERQPEVAFATISGDLVGTGMEREDWDLFFTYGQPMFQSRPVMPAIGNHDAQLGLGAGMYLDIFGLPEQGPEGIPTESAYTFSYSNAQFFVLDVMSDSAPQREWLKEELAKSTAPWKIAYFHFPLFAGSREYPRLEQDWGTLFDEFHVDLVLAGHVHQYMRTLPLHAGEIVDSTAEGTVHLTTVCVPSRPLRDRERPDYITKAVGGGVINCAITIDGGKLEVKAMRTDGTVVDEFEIVK